MTTTKLKILFSLLLWPFLLNAQSIVDIINTTEKAVFEARAYNSAKLQTGTASGFFLSSDGIAITMGNIFEKADSAVISLRSGKTFEIERSLSLSLSVFIYWLSGLDV